MSNFAFPINASAGSPSYGAAGMRRALAAMLMPGAGGLQITAGVRPGTGLDVTVSGSTITVTVGSALVLGASNSTQGPYLCWVDGSATLTLTAADGTNPRIDLVYLQVRDTDMDGSGFRDCTLQYLAGTAAASPVAPSIPGGASGIVLATISVPKVGSGSPTVSYSTRQTSVASGGVQPVPSGLLATAGLYTGQVRYNTTRAMIETWTGSAWVAPGDWTTYPPTWTATTTTPVRNSGTLTGRYALAGKSCTVKIELLTAGDTTFGSGQYAWALPFPASANGTGVSIGAGHGITSGGRWDLQGLITSTQSVVSVLGPTSQTDNRLAFLSSSAGMGGVAWTTSQTTRVQVTYEIA